MLSLTLTGSIEIERGGEKNITIINNCGGGDCGAVATATVMANAVEMVKTTASTVVVAAPSNGMALAWGFWLTRPHGHLFALFIVYSLLIGLCVHYCRMLAGVIKAKANLISHRLSPRPRTIFLVDCCVLFVVSCPQRQIFGPLTFL